MRIYQVFIILLGFSLITLKIFFEKGSNVDALVVLIYFMLYIPIVGKYLESAKFLGSEFKFKNEIEKAKEYVKLSNEAIETSKNLNIENQENKNGFETFDLSVAKMIINTDHVLALASLRIEIERKLRTLSKFLFGEDNNLPLIRVVEQFSGAFFHKEQVKALRKIIEICNKAIHGYDISYDQAREIIELAAELNISFPTGYSINILPNHNFEKDGFVCEYEHCIERMPLPIDDELEDACPIFGHFCPGGEASLRKCRLSLDNHKK